MWEFTSLVGAPRAKQIQVPRRGTEVALPAGMKLIAGALLTATFAMGCAVGPDDEEVLPIDPNPARVACSAAFTLSGTYVPGTPTRNLNPSSPEYAPSGCWGVGTWTFTAAIDRAAEVPDITGDKAGDRCGEYNGTAEPRVEASYSFRVDRIESTNTNGQPDGTGSLLKLTLLAGKASSEVIQLKIGDDGAGDCESDFELRSADRMMEWIFKPSQTDADGKIAGAGHFVQFLDPQ